MSRTNFNYKILYSLFGLFVINICFYISFYYRFNSFSLIDGYRQNDIGYELVLLLLNLVFLLSASKNAAFLYEKNALFMNLFRLSFRDTFAMVLGYALFIMVVKGDWFSREFILVYSTLYGFSLGVLRIVLYAYFQYQIEKTYANRKIVVFGTYKDIEFLVHNYIRKRDHVKYMFCYDSNVTHFEQYYLHPIEEYKELLKSEDFINEAVIVSHNAEQFYEIYHRCLELGIRTKIIPSFYEKIETKFEMETHSYIPVLKLQSEPLQEPYNQLLKRTFDLVFSIVILVSLFPLLVFILGTIIKLTSRGPIFFKQIRSGLNHKSFTCWKFRTMRVIDQKIADNLQATKDDPRVTWIGKLMRRTNLDEFPQFLNVFFGDMSVVGPRPHPLPLNKRFADTMSFYMTRHHCKPGVTGWAQANGYRGETKEDFQMEKRIEFDRYYIYNWSFLLDLKIIFLTVFKMFTGDEKAF